MSHKTNSTIRMMVGDGATVPRMMKTQPTNVEKHGATMPKMQPTIPTQISGSASTAQQSSKNSSK